MRRTSKVVLRQMLCVGDTVVYDGRSYRVVGFTPMSVVPARVEIEDFEAEERLTVEVVELEPALAAHATATV